MLRLLSHSISIRQGVSPSLACRLTRRPDITRTLAQRLHPVGIIETMDTRSGRTVFKEDVPSKHDTYTQCWVDVVAASQTLPQHQPNISLMYRASRVVGFIEGFHHDPDRSRRRTNFIVGNQFSAWQAYCAHWKDIVDKQCQIRRAGGTPKNCRNLPRPGPGN